MVLSAAIESGSTRSEYGVWKSGLAMLHGGADWLDVVPVLRQQLHQLSVGSSTSALSRWTLKVVPPDWTQITATSRTSSTLTTSG